MELLHKTNSKKLSGLSLNNSDYNSFILSNNIGSFYFGTAAKSNFSSYNGFFSPYIENQETKEWNLFKTVSFIGIKKQPDKLVNLNASIALHKKNAIEDFFMAKTNTLIYSISKYNGEIPLFLDCKKIYDFSTQGRVHKITKENNCIVIEYKKFEDDSLKKEQYSFFLAVKSDLEEVRIEKWEEEQYNYDSKRSNSDKKSYVFHALNFNTNIQKNIIAISFSQNKDEAISNVNDSFENYHEIKKEKSQEAISKKQNLSNLSLQDEVAYQSSISSFNNLIQEINGFEGIYAGFPWFFHFWARDEAISSIALLKQEKYGLMKQILLRLLSSGKDGRIANRFPNADLGSADSTGWTMFRLLNLIQTLSEKEILDQYFKKEELKNLLNLCQDKISKIESIHLKEGLIENEALETWMDTGKYVGDVREGFRIEIQALQIASYNLIIYLSELLKENSEEIKTKKQEMLQRIKDVFHKNGYLYDGKDDATIRPNIFIAAYVAPEILTKKEWVSCFQKLIPKLQMNYTKTSCGIATIDKTSNLFNEYYTGESNASYHRGDVWYWLNSLIAITLKRIGQNKGENLFSGIINGIKEAHIKELLWSGAIGCSAEISCAKKLTSDGCFSQAWSYALFIELMHELN